MAVDTQAGWATDGRFGERVIRRRTQLGMTLQELADAVGKDVKTASRWQHGGVPRSGEVLRKLAAVLETTPGFLLLGEADDGE